MTNKERDEQIKIIERAEKMSKLISGYTKLFQMQAEYPGNVPEGCRDQFLVKAAMYTAVKMVLEELGDFAIVTRFTSTTKFLNERMMDIFAAPLLSEDQWREIAKRANDKRGD